MTEILNHRTDAKTAREVCLVRFETDLHRDLLLGWLQSPHIMRWWGDPEPQLAAALDRPEGSGHSLISVDGKLTGYLRWQRVSRVALDAVGLHEIPDDAVDIDILIGEPAFTQSKLRVWKSLPREKRRRDWLELLNEF